MARLACAATNAEERSGMFTPRCGRVEFRAHPTPSGFAKLHDRPLQSRHIGKPESSGGGIEAAKVAGQRLDTDADTGSRSWRPGEPREDPRGTDSDVGPTDHGVIPVP